MHAYYAKEFALWNDRIPPFTQEEDHSRVEHFKDDTDGIDRLINVTNPTITFFPATRLGPHPAVVVCPGGGYYYLTWNLEGTDICAKLNAAGFSAFLLKYRCPDRREGARADAARAIRMIRANAKEWDVDPARIGIIGFSAGSHLSASISAPADPVPYEPADEIDALPFRPDCTALIYPWSLTKEGAIAPEFKVDETIPPVLMIQTEDDFAKPEENSVPWFLACKAAGVPAELHIYPSGGHGYGIIPSEDPVSVWGDIAITFFTRQLKAK